MGKFYDQEATDLGLPPGTLVHVGRKRTAAVRITVIDYNEDEFQERVVEDPSECAVFKERETVTWINVDGVHEMDVIEKIGACFDIHPLVQEDIANTGQRPKLEDYGDYLYAVLKMISHAGGEARLDVEQVSIILGKSFVISFQEKEGDVFSAVRDRLRNSKGNIRARGADYLAHGLMDAVVDHYFVVLETLGESIEALEEAVVTRATPETLRQMHAIKRQLIFLRKSVWPLREVISNLQRGESPLVSDGTGLYLRDLYDHTIQVIDTVESFRDMAAGILDIYLSTMSNKMNEVMKVLTIIATLFIPLTFVAGVYGMNFKHMPELDWRLGYPLVLLIMLAICVVMLVYFRRKRWI